jgi:hypothetical protein
VDVLGLAAVLQEVSERVLIDSVSQVAQKNACVAVGVWCALVVAIWYLVWGLIG